MEYALRQTGHRGLHIISYDLNMVEPNNTGRQLYTLFHIKDYKAANSVNKANIAFGLQWQDIQVDALPDDEDILVNIITTSARRKNSNQINTRHDEKMSIKPFFAQIFLQQPPLSTDKLCTKHWIARP